MSNQPSIISDRPYSVASDESKRGTFALYCGGVAVCFGRSEAEAQAMADSSNDKHERIAKRKRLEAAAPELLAALKTVMSEADFGDPALAEQCRAAIAKAEGRA